MTRIILIIMALTIAFSNSLSASNEIMWAEFIHNVGNDKDYILVGSDGYRDRLVVSQVNIETNEIKYRVLYKYHRYPEYISFNTEKKRIAIKGNSPYEIFIYNYDSGDLVSTIAIDSIYNTFELSKNGDFLYIISPIDFTFRSYDVETGEIAKEFVLTGAINNKFHYIDTEKDEIVVSNGNDKDFWSISEGKKVRTGKGSSPFIFAETLQDGALIAHIKDGTFYIDSTSDGTNIFTKKFFENNDELMNFYDCKLCTLDVTSDMKYMLLNYSEREQIIYDIVNDSIIELAPIIIDGYEERPPYVHAINSDFTKSLVSYNRSKYCGGYLEMPMPWNKFYIYDIVHSKNSSSIPEGHIEGINAPIFGDDLQKIVLYNQDMKILVDKDEKFLRYINIDETPVILYENSTLLGVLDSGIFRTYNLTTEKYEKEFKIEIDNIIKVYFPQNQDVILFQDSNKVYVYDFNTFSQLREFDFASLGIKPENLKFDGSKLIVGNKNYNLYNYDIYSGTMITYQGKSSYGDYKYMDFTRDGEHLVFLTSYNKVLKHNIRTNQEKITTLLSDNLRDYTPFRGFGVLGNHDYVWFIYSKDPTQEANTTSVIYNLSDDTESALFGGSRPIVSDNGKMYMGSSCPNRYAFRLINDPQSSVETYTTITGSVYPNPASDFIKIDMNASAMNSSIEIFDAYGKQVMSVIYSGEDIDISKLTAGVYFVKTPSHSYKFIKL